MQGHAADQIASIHAMMSTGHRSVTMERHSLWLWGITAAALILSVRYLLTPDLFTIRWHHILVSNVYIAMVVVTVAVIDLRLTHKAREARDETLSFIQIQLTKVWWLILSLIVLINVGMNIFGGGMLFYPILLALIGLAFYIQGLFSRQLLAWAGIIMILLGLISVSLNLPLLTQEWLAIVVFGFGLPSLGLFINSVQSAQHRTQQSVFFVAWVCMILVLAASINYWYQQMDSIDLPVVTLKEYQSREGEHLPAQIVRIPAGTIVPIEVSIEGDALKGKNTAVAPLQLSEDLDIVLVNGKPDGRFRGADGQWKQRRTHYQLRDFKLNSAVQAESGPKVLLSFFISTKG